MTDKTAASTVPDTTRGLVLALLIIAAIVAAIALRLRPPEPRPASASVEAFSAERGIAALAHALGDGKPHPIGSEANHRVRDRLLEQLRALGYEPTVQRGFACEGWAVCGLAENIVARVPGREPGADVLLSAHYDSVPAGPGAADDGAGVAAVLEIARVLRVRPTPRHSIILLITDGEEAGLLGARVFIREHPWAASVRAAVNMDARGTSGPSFLFETGTLNAWAMALYDGHITTPITNSIYFTAYKLLPNDTDFTVYKLRDWQGFNFAFTGDVQHYHTPLDDLAHLDPASVQHQGDNALETLSLLAEADLPALSDPPGTIRKAPEEAVYFDVLAAGILRWPVGAALPMAVGSILGCMVMVGVLVRRRRTAIKPVAMGFVGVLIALLATAAASKGLELLLRSLGALPTAEAGYQWLARPLPYEVANAALASLVLAVFVRGLARVAGYWGLWAGTLLLFGLLTIATSLWLPGLSFAFLLPTVAMLITVVPALLAREDHGAGRQFAAIPGVVIAMITLLPTIWFLYETLGVGLLPAVASLLALTLLPLAPLFATASVRARNLLMVASGLSLLGAGGIALAQPVYDRESPQRLNFEYAIDADQGTAEWLAYPDSGHLPALAAGAPVFARRSGPVFPWSRRIAFSAKAEKLVLPPPEMAVLSAETIDGRARYRAHLSSPRGAPVITICFPPEAGLVAATLGGYELPAESPDEAGRNRQWHRGWRCLTSVTLGPEGLDIGFDLTAKAPVNITLSDRNFGLPPEGAALIAARPVEAVASQDGDSTRVMRRLTIPLP